MWFRKQKAEKEERRGRKNQEAQRSKEELSSLEKAKQDKKLAVLESERQAYHRNKGNAKGKLNENTAGMPLKISGFVIVGSNSLQLIAIYHLPMQKC